MKAWKSTLCFVLVFGPIHSRAKAVESNPPLTAIPSHGESRTTGMCQINKPILSFGPLPGPFGTGNIERNASQNSEYCIAGRGRYVLAKFCIIPLRAMILGKECTLGRCLEVCDELG